MAIVEVSVVPLGTGTPSVSKHVARALGVLKSQETVSYELTPMGTILEGDLDTVLGVVRRMHESAFDGVVQRVLTRVVIDDRRDRPSSMEHKVRSVEAKLRKK